MTRTGSVAPPPSTTAHGGASDVAPGDKDDCFICCCKIYIIVFMLMYPLWWSVIFYKTTSNPTFKVESISVSPYNVSDMSFMTAKWNIGVSVRNPNRDRTIAYKGIDVSFNRTTTGYSLGETRLYSLGTHIPIAFHQGPNNSTLVYATIDASSPQYVPRQNDGGQYLEFDVKIKAHVNVVVWIYSRGFRVQGVCRDMKIGISPNATQGFWLGRPKSCS